MRSPGRATLTLCLITDRRRLATTCRVPLDSATPLVVEQAAGAIAGGIDVIQVREADLSAAELLDLVRRIVATGSGSRTRIVVNDRPDVALIAGAHGVHLRESGIGVADARRVLRPPAIVGRSIHSVATAASSATADYLIAGSVFETESHPGASTLGLDGLRDVVRAAGQCPVWAVGGVTLDRIGSVVQCGVAGVAAIGAFIPAASRFELIAATEKLARKWRFSFDSAVELP